MDSRCPVSGASSSLRGTPSGNTSSTTALSATRPTDFGQIVLHSGLPSNCYADNTAPAGSTPPNLEQLQPTCGVTATTTNCDNTLVTQVECDPRLAPCPAGAQYPAQTGVQLRTVARRIADHGQPLRRRALERLVPLGRVGGFVARRSPRAGPAGPGSAPAAAAAVDAGSRRARLTLRVAPGRRAPPRADDDVAAGRLGGPVRDQQDAAVARRGEHAVDELVGQAGSRPLVGSSSTTTGPGASSARATASRRRSPPDRAKPSSPTGVSSPWGSPATQASRRAARRARASSSSVARGDPG